MAVTKLVVRFDETEVHGCVQRIAARSLGGGESTAKIFKPPCDDFMVEIPITGKAILDDLEHAARQRAFGSNQTVRGTVARLFVENGRDLPTAIIEFDWDPRK